MQVSFTIVIIILKKLSSCSGQSRPQFALATANVEAQRFNRAVLTYDFIYLLIAIAATLLFVFETLYRVFNLFNATSSSGRKYVHRKKRHIGISGSEIFDEDMEEMCQKIVESVYTLTKLYE